MAATPSPLSSQFVWYELLTSDPPAAEAFYAKVVGWQTVDAGMPHAYTLLKAGNHTVAGLMAIPPEAKAMGAQPHWEGYVGVADCDAHAAAIAAAGGTVCKPAADIPGVGRFAVVADPQGAVFSVFTGAPGDVPPSPAPGTPGTVGWHELHAADGVKAFEFYSSQFGWTKDTTMDMGPMGVYQLFAAGGAAIGGVMTKMPEQPMPAWLFYFVVDAADAAVARIQAAGGRVLHGPAEVPGGSWVVNAMDPQGAMFATVSPKR